MSMILTYDSVKRKPDTLRAMTSLNRNEFELLCLSFSQVLEEETQQSKRDVSQGGRKPILNKNGNYSGIQKLHSLIMVNAAFIEKHEMG